MPEKLISKRFGKVTTANDSGLRVTLTSELIDMGYDPTKDYPDNELDIQLIEENGKKKIVIEKAGE